MEKQFQLRLYKSAITNLVILLAIPTGIAIIGVTVSQIRDEKLALVLSAFMLGAGGYGVYQGLKKWVVYDVIVSVKNDELLMRRLDTGEATQILFADVASYRFSVDKSVYQLRFKLFNGRIKRLRANSSFAVVDTFMEMVNAVTTAAIPYQNLCPATMVREKEFFENAISTVILLVITVGMGLLIWKSTQDHQPRWSPLMGLMGLYILYVFFWFRFTKLRKQAS